MFVRSGLCFVFVIIVKVYSKCETTFTNQCEKVKDIERYGKKSWDSLIISPEKCKRTTSHTLDEVITENAFKKTPNIEELMIMEKITGIEAGAFNGIKRLEHLKFYKNQLTVIPRLAFANLHIHKLDLSHNAIENIVHDLFRQSTVTILNLSHNKLNNIQINMVNIPSLKRLIISHNNVQSIVDGAFHENLEQLNLAFNDISQIEEGVIKPLTNLKELNLSHNRLNRIQVSFGMPSLETLDLSHNVIDQIAEGSFGQFFELKRLILNHNYLTSLPHKIFPNPNPIVTIFLHSNALMYVPEETTEALQDIREVTFSGNPWSCTCLKSFNEFLQERNISEPDCDQKYFGKGNSAVCIITTNTCTFDERLTQEDFDNFRNSRQQDPCAEI
ncbi:hypothetical protein PPYR_13831 [Photinus pyralis]|uniref:LRRCT domain-containing protein n=2 Tax=Photinus pyralis TaxID=7054 RepID=A0A5N4AA57_PHOPY|nr:leucine-rich repeat-containing protein 15-like [Photinus pyralis]KAB0794211.1 hypothetical protein PPYR_13831 [Photinus pyralis]